MQAGAPASTVIWLVGWSAMASADAKSAKAAELIAKIAATQDFYEVLGVSRDADDAAI
eukprot:SAG31_NODE_36299_length_314_cov_1.209302_1_plen_57_part_01